eukprot:1820332-Amphidinium_carterae.1
MSHVSVLVACMRAEAEYGHIRLWHVASVTDMSMLFAQLNAFNSNIGTWDTSSVTDMSYMFLNAAAFNQDLGNWSTGK